MWGLYENLPPPSSSITVPLTTNLSKTNNAAENTPQSQKDEWSVEAKLLAPALRRKTAAAHVNIKKISKSASQKRELAQAVNSDVTPPLEQTQIQSTISIWSGVQDAYDPLQPNEYEKVLQDRKKQRTQEQTPRVSAAFAPPQNYYQEDEAELLVAAPSAPCFFKPQTTNANVAAKMMARMGYKEGHGLGKTEQGITAPLIAKKADNRTAVLVHPEDNSSTTTNNLQLSKVLLLLNVVGPGEVDEYLQPEIQEECTKFGPVESCKIVEDTDKATPPEQAVRIFVRFCKQEGAQKAYEGLHGRYFGGRVVQAFFFDEARFKNNDLKISK